MLKFESKRGKVSVEAEGNVIEIVADVTEEKQENELF